MYASSEPSRAVISGQSEIPSDHDSNCGVVPAVLKGNESAFAQVSCSFQRRLSTKSGPRIPVETFPVFAARPAVHAGDGSFNASS